MATANTVQVAIRMMGRYRQAGGKDAQILVDLMKLLRAVELEGAVQIRTNGGGVIETTYEQANFDIAHDLSRQVRAAATEAIRTGSGSENLLDTVKASLLFDAPYDFDAAIRYAEWNRPQKRKFYEPRRKQLLPIVKAMQELEDRKIRLLGIMSAPGVGKTTLGEFFQVWTGMKHPELSILSGSHSNSLLRGLYDEILRLLDPNGEYLWSEIFPDSPVVGKSALDMRIDLGRNKRFETFEFSSIGSGNAGKVRASNLLYADDLVDGIESAMSRDRMEKLCQQYYTDLRQRMIGDAVELLIQTPWALTDPIDQLEMQNLNNPQAKFIHLPALDENDESNFDYPYNLGFTTEFYHNQRDLMDDASWRAIYMTQPIEREGLLYDPERLRRFESLPPQEPDAIIAVCDTKTSGSDFFAMPIAYKYGEDYYIADILFQNYGVDIVQPQLAERLVLHGVHLAQFESNVAGSEIAKTVQDMVTLRGGVTKITSHWTQANKETKIVVNAGFVLTKCLFKSENILHKPENKEYRQAFQAMCSYTLSGRNKHDDMCDAMAQLALFAQSGLKKTKVQLLRRLF